MATILTTVQYLGFDPRPLAKILKPQVYHGTRLELGMILVFLFPPFLSLQSGTMKLKHGRRTKHTHTHNTCNKCHDFFDVGKWSYCIWRRFVLVSWAKRAKDYKPQKMPHELLQTKTTETNSKKTVMCIKHADSHLRLSIDPDLSLLELCLEPGEPGTHTLPRIHRR